MSLTVVLNMGMNVTNFEDFLLIFMTNLSCRLPMSAARIFFGIAKFVEITAFSKCLKTSFRENGAGLVCYTDRGTDINSVGRVT